MSFDEFKALVGSTFRDPEGTARYLIAQGWPIPARWMALLMAVSISTILTFLSVPETATGVDPDGVAQPSLILQPLALAGMQFAAVVFAAGLMAQVGRMFGGKGRFEDALLLTVWVEILLLVVQVVQLGFWLILPTVAGLIGLAAIVMFLWLTVMFTKALHGFTSTPKVALGLLGTVLVAGFILSFFAAAFGLLPEIPQ